MTLTLRELSKIAHVGIRNQDALRRKKITGVSTDSRSIAAGNLFIALKGPNFDGHKFLGDVFRKGALAAIVEQSAGIAVDTSIPLIVVEDTTKALGELAGVYRKRFKIPVLAVAGSNGKTTTKEMISQVLRSKFNVLSTEGNLNNHIGVPQTLLQLRKKHDIAVVEIGTNHPGEIRYLCDILKPTHGLITNIGSEHLEFFKSIEGVAEEEGELFESLQRDKKGVAFINADDARVVERASKIRKHVRYGIVARKADVKGKILAMQDAASVRFQFSGKGVKKPVKLRIGIAGVHNATNALAAVAVGLAFKVTPKQISSALETFMPASKRMEVEDVGGVLVFNDTYNANPDSMIAALQTLSSANVTGKKIAVLADMLELGERAEEEHARVGGEAARLGIEYVLTFGRLAKRIHSSAKGSITLHYDQKNMLAEYLAELVAPGDAVLVKGSRGMRMEDVVTFLKERLQPPTSGPGQSKDMRSS